MIICQETQCTGCFACINECKLDCISMEENHYGELPKIDDSKCIECGACQKVSKQCRKFHTDIPLSAIS